MTERRPTDKLEAMYQNAITVRESADRFSTSYTVEYCGMKTEIDAIASNFIIVSQINAFMCRVDGIRKLSCDAGSLGDRLEDVVHIARDFPCPWLGGPTYFWKQPVSIA